MFSVLRTEAHEKIGLLRNMRPVWRAGVNKFSLLDSVGKYLLISVFEF